MSSSSRASVALVFSLLYLVELAIKLGLESSFSQVFNDTLSGLIITELFWLFISPEESLRKFLVWGKLFILPRVLNYVH